MQRGFTKNKVEGKEKGREHHASKKCTLITDMAPRAAAMV